MCDLTILSEMGMGSCTPREVPFRDNIDYSSLALNAEEASKYFGRRSSSNPTQHFMHQSFVTDEIGIKDCYERQCMPYEDEFYETVMSSWAHD